MASASGADLIKVPEGTEFIQVSSDKHKYINNKYTKVSAKMYDYKCDIKLKVGRQAFKAHRDVLAEASDYFSAMFSHNMLEKEQNVIELHDMSPQGFSCMMEYFYHGHVTIDSRNIDDILEAARFFHIEWLIHVCCDFLIRHLCLENYDTVLQLADKFYLGDLRLDIFRFITRNFLQLGEQNKFTRLSYELLFQLLDEDYFIDATEGFIFNVVWKWLQTEPEERSEHKLTMLKLIRYPLLEQEELLYIPSEVMELPEIKQLVDEALDYHSNPSQQCLKTSDKTEVRGAADVLVLFSALDDLNQIQYKVPGEPGYFSEVVNSSFMQSVFEFSSVAVLGNFLFVAGGYDRRSWCSSPAFYRYNPRNRAWAQLSSMRQARVSFALCKAERGLYAVAGIEHIVEAGRDSETILDDVEYYSPQDNMWSTIPPLPRGCFSIASCVVDERLYVSGGISDDPEDNVPVNYLHEYHPGDKSWSPKARMITERQGHGMIGLKDQVFVFGGYTVGPDTMSFSNCLENEMFDIETNQWSQIKDTPAEFCHFHSSITTLNDRIYIIGGRDVEMRSLHCYNDQEDAYEEWEMCGTHVLKLVTMRVAFPLDLIGNGSEVESKSAALDILVEGE